MMLTRGTKIALIALLVYMVILAIGMLAASPGNRGFAIGVVAINGAFWLGVIGFWRWYVRPYKIRPELFRYCTRCGAVEERMFYAQGSWLVCVLLCFLFLIPGIIYYVWMRSTERYGCQKCGSPDIIPLDSPAAQRVAASVRKADDAEELVRIAQRVHENGGSLNTLTEAEMLQYARFLVKEGLASETEQRFVQAHDQLERAEVAAAAAKREYDAEHVQSGGAAGRQIPMS